MSGLSDWPIVEKLVERAPVKRRMVLRRRRGKRHGFPAGVYVIAYHSIYDEASAQPWELLYDRVLTRASDFAAQLAFLRNHMQAVALAEIPALFGQDLDAPYFALTFDDAYVSIAGRAADLCAAAGVEPTVFTCADFAAGRSVYYRVPLLLLEAEGHAPQLARSLSEALPEHAFSPLDLMTETKNWYRKGVTDRIVLDEWRRHHGDEFPRVHLSFDELRALGRRGWTVGNHTRSHATLAGLSAHELDEEIVGNHDELAQESLEPIPWVAYPNGRARDVDPAVNEWFDAHAWLNGAHANGGVNFAPSRTEWLRIPVSDEPVSAFEHRLRRAVDASRWLQTQLGAS